jgi:transcriptional regulator with XRE-family HTH domain
MQNKAYRDAYVQSQIRTALPFQLRALRTGKGWSQGTIAERAGMAQPRISELERPSGRMPNLDTLCRIAAAHDVALDVRFVPFSELIERSEGFDPDHFTVKTFEEEIRETERREQVSKESEVIRKGIADYLSNSDRMAAIPTAQEFAAQVPAIKAQLLITTWKKLQAETIILGVNESIEPLDSAIVSPTPPIPSSFPFPEPKVECQKRKRTNTKRAWGKHSRIGMLRRSNRSAVGRFGR